MIKRLCIFVSLLSVQMFWSATAYGTPPTTQTEELDAATDNGFFDSLAVRTSQRNALYRLLGRKLIVPSQTDEDVYDKVVDESKMFDAYEGCEIADVELSVHNIYTTPNSFMQRTANTLHMLTRQNVVRRDLLFKAGERVDAELLVKNLQLLRSREYVYDAEIRLVPLEDAPDKVKIYVNTYDNWTIDLSWQVDDVRTSVGAADANFLGMGNTLSIKTNYDYNNGYGGTVARYDIPNVFGTFFRGSLLMGRNFKVEHYRAELGKEFIRPSDYMAGGVFDIYEIPYTLLETDSTVRVSARTLDLWAGKSQNIKSLGSSVFITGRYGKTDFFKRTDVDFDLNSAFHNTDFLFFSAGLYREKFYAASLVYGYGYKESIAAGYKLELTGGHINGEFNDLYYTGAELGMAQMFKFGYLGADIASGYYFNTQEHTWQQGVLKVELRFFTNLLTVKHGHIREFISVNNTRGWRRRDGEGDIITFTEKHGPRGFDDYMTGTNRLSVNTETVFFSMWHPLGFRVAPYGFIDVGTIGFDNNMFRNDLFTTLGIGIRLKNERLIFSTVQLQLGLAFGKNGFMKNQIMQLSSQQRMKSFEFSPKKPSVVDYK